MQIIPIMSTKGGVGKSKTCVGIGRALKQMGFKVGFLDADWVAPNLNIELGINPDGGWLIGDVIDDKIKPIISPEGFPLVSSAFLFPPDQAISMGEEELVKDISEITHEGVVAWGDLDYLMMDTPPTTAKFIQMALMMKGLLGVVMVSQPGSLALADLHRTVSLLRDMQVPVIGLIGNQMYVECQCGRCLDLFDLTEQDVLSFCSSQGLHWLGSIPHRTVAQKELLDSDYHIIAGRILKAEPQLLPKLEYSKLPYKILVAIARKAKENGKD